MRRKRNERGEVTVEAAFIFPLAILIVILLLYLSILLFQKANLQAGLEAALVYYQATVTDNYITPLGAVDYTAAEGLTMGTGNVYQADKPLNPYEDLLGNAHGLNGADFEKYFDSISGNMLFDSDVKIEFQYTNYALYKELWASAVQTIKLPIDFSFIGLSNEYKITASAKAAVADHDDMIHTLDYAFFLLADTKVGEFAKTITEKIGEGYNKLKGWLEGL